jgi:hypothetical protein
MTYDAYRDGHSKLMMMMIMMMPHNFLLRILDVSQPKVRLCKGVVVGHR